MRLPSPSGLADPIGEVGLHGGDGAVWRRIGVSTSPSQTSAQAAVAALSWRSVVRIDDGELDVVLVEPVAQRPVDGTHASVVVALTDQVGGGTVLTSDPRGLSALAGHTKHSIRIGTV